MSDLSYWTELGRKQGFVNVVTIPYPADDAVNWCKALFGDGSYANICQSVGILEHRPEAVWDFMGAWTDDGNKVVLFFFKDLPDPELIEFKLRFG